jgi:sugar phosphate isomerase/epimerase
MVLNSYLDRREFLKKSGAVGLAVSGLMYSSTNTAKGEPKKPDIKVGLYSVTFSGVWYDGPALSVKEVLNKAKSLGYDGIELGAKRPHISPLDVDKNGCSEIRKLADSLGLEICAVASYNSFTNPIVEQRENEILMLKEQMRVARDLGVKILRIFAAWNGVTMEDGKAKYDDAARAWSIAFPMVTREQKWKWCRECLEESAKNAKKYGVTLALQNHEPLIESYKDVLALINEVGSENLKACHDAPLLKFQNDEHVRQSVIDVGKNLLVHSHFGGEYAKKSDGTIYQTKFRPDREDTNYPTFVKTLAEIGYKGYISYELCHPFKIEGKYGALKDSEQQAALSLEYMKNIINKTVV